jgi:hypothetical protein
MASPQSPQGVLAPDILLSNEVADFDDRDLMQELVDFVNWLLEDARLVFAEIGDAARGLYLTDQYIVQVENGGHTQYVGNVVCANAKFGTLDRSMELISETLAQCGEEGYTIVFRDFSNLLNANNEIFAAQHRDPSDVPHYAELRALDDRFFALDIEKLDAAPARLLRGSPALRLLSADAKTAEQAKIIARNALFDERGRARAAALGRTPMYFAPRRLCDMVGLEFVRINAGGPTPSPNVMSWGITTSDGPRLMLLGPNFAELFDMNQTTRLARIEF